MGSEDFPVSVGKDPCHELPISGLPKVEGRPSTGCEEVVHVLSCSLVLPVRPVLDVLPL